MEQIRAEFDHLVDEMEWVDVISTLQNMLNTMGDTTSARPLLPSPAEAVGQGFGAESQLVGGQGGGFDAFLPPGPIFGLPNQMMAAPNMFHPPLHHPMAAPNTFSQAPFANPPFDLKGQAGPFNPNQGKNASVWMPLDDSKPKPVKDFTKRKIEEQLDFERPYVKRPPNAFVLFMKEHRPKVVAELKSRNNSAINTILGQRWRALSAEEQAPYYEQAKMERQLHAQQHPHWSIKENYGKKRKRVRCKGATDVIVTAAQTGVMEAESCSTALTQPNCDTGHLLQRPKVNSSCPPDAQADVAAETTLTTTAQIQPQAPEATQVHHAEDKVPPGLESALLPPSWEGVTGPECPLGLRQSAATPPAAPAPTQSQPPSAEFNVSLSFGDDLLLMPDDAFAIPAAPAQPAGGAVTQPTGASVRPLPTIHGPFWPPRVPEGDLVEVPRTTARTAAIAPPQTGGPRVGQEVCVEGGVGASAGQ